MPKSSTDLSSRKFSIKTHHSLKYLKE